MMGLITNVQLPLWELAKRLRRSETAASLHNKLSASGIQHSVLHHGLLKTQFRSRVIFPVPPLRAAMNARSGDIVDMFKEPVGRSARQVSRGHARNRETYHHPYTKTRSRCCYGRQCSVSAVSHQGDRCIAVSRGLLPDLLLALLALDNATPGYLDVRGWICFHTGRLRYWGRQANIHYWATTARTAAGEFNCSGSAQAGHQPRSRARDTGAETLEPSRPGRTGSLCH